MPSFQNILDIFETAGPYVEAGTKIAGGIAGNRAQNRALGNINRGIRDDAALQRYQAEQQAKYAAANLAEQAVQDRAQRYLTAGRERAGQAAFGDALANIGDVEIAGVPDYIPKISFGGGLRPSVFGAGAREAGRTLSRDALAAMLSGADVPNLPNLGGLGGAAPELSELEEPGRIDKILEGIGYAGTGIGAINEARRAGRTTGRTPTTDERVRAALPRLPITAQLPKQTAAQNARIPTAFESQLAGLNPSRAELLGPSQYLDAVAALRDAQARGLL